MVRADSLVSCQAWAAEALAVQEVPHVINVTWDL